MSEKIPEFVERAIQTAIFHSEKVKENPKHRVSDTAKELKRSVGSVSEDLLIASWLRSHRDKLLKFNYRMDALDFIRKKKLQSITGVDYLKEN